MQRPWAPGRLPAPGRLWLNPAMAEVELAASIGAMIVQIAASRGADAVALAASAGFDPALSADPDARIPLALEEKLWNEAAHRTADDAFGLHAAELVRPGSFDVFDYALRTAPTLRVSLERLARYNRLVHDAAVFTLIERGERLRVEHTFVVPGAKQCRHSAEFTIAAVVRVGEQIAQRKLEPRAVEFRHAAPSSAATLAEHQRFFGIAPRFSSAVNAVELDLEQLERPVPNADPVLWRVLERHAEALLKARPDLGSSAAARVRQLLVVALSEGEGTLAAIAGKLKSSERTLQRWLADENTSFESLLDEVRHQLSLRYLADRKLAIGEVAYLLGYSDPSPFHRAFKRWTGVTPSEARRRAA
jgi:AraC-like DNA-binding protein